jgi:hypothetical protein
MNKGGTVIGPEGTETIVCMNDLAKAGGKVSWTKDGIKISRGNIVLPIELRNGQPVLPNEVRLALIDEIEEAKAKELMSLKTLDDDFTIKSIWPQLKKALTWLMKHQFEGAAELLATIVTSRKKELDMEVTNTEEQLKLMFEQVKHRQKANIKTVLFEVSCEKTAD